MQLHKITPKRLLLFSLCLLCQRGQVSPCQALTVHNVLPRISIPQQVLGRTERRYKETAVALSIVALSSLNQPAAAASPDTAVTIPREASQVPARLARGTAPSHVQVLQSQPTVSHKAVLQPTESNRGTFSVISSTLDLANSGETSEKQEKSAATQFGEFFFLSYIVFSLLAGLKGILDGWRPKF